MLIQKQKTEMPGQIYFLLQDQQSLFETEAVSSKICHAL